MKHSKTLVAAVTGGGQGIGKVITRSLLKAGFTVFILEHDPEAGKETAAEFEGLKKLTFLECNIADEGEVINSFKTIKQGPGHLDLLVNNAGFSRNKPLEELTLGDWNAVINTNLTGAFLCAKYAVPLLRAAKGSIINISSTRAHMSEPNTEAYSASKGGLLALTHSLAISLGPDIRVNCISPGWIDVSPYQKKSEKNPDELSEQDYKQHPAGRVGIPDDIAAMVNFLSGPEASFITGQEFIIDGGMTRKMIYV